MSRYSYPILIYGLMLIGLFTNTIDEESFFYAIVVGIIYISAKEPNIRSLLIIIILVDTAFFELDYYVYYVSKYIIETGKVVGDLLLNTLIIINNIALTFCIYYRKEIMDCSSNILGTQKHIYYPTKADSFQLRILRLMLAYNVIGTVFLAYFAYQHYFVGSPSALQSFSSVRDEYQEYFSIMQQLKLFFIAVVVHAWSQKPISNDGNKYKF